jgi:4-aminobutyrate aminotransferase/(S)-3-amino-2-methylpropionate transaminase
MQTGGYFYKEHLRPGQPYRIYNTWLGDPTRILLLEAVISTIRNENLLELNRKTGKLTRSGVY